MNVAARSIVDTGHDTTAFRATVGPAHMRGTLIADIHGLDFAVAPRSASIWPAPALE
jgi:hypothetical protein